MSIPPQYEGKLSPAAASIFSRYPNEYGWDFLPTTNGELDFICIHCGRTTEVTYEVREPCACQTQSKKKKS